MRSFAFVSFQVGHHAAISAKHQMSANKIAAAATQGCADATAGGVRTGLAHRGASEKLRKSFEEAVTIESGEQAPARVTIREVPDKNISKARAHRR
jgi:hypothetical protein